MTVRKWRAGAGYGTSDCGRLRKGHLLARPSHRGGVRRT